MGYIDTCGTIQECTLCLHEAKKQKEEDEGTLISDFIVREECGNKCPDDFVDLRMQKDGSYILKNPQQHFTENSEENAKLKDMMPCMFDTIIEGESCTLKAFMDRKDNGDQTESNIIIGALD